MKKYFATFGVDQKYAGMIQPIYAVNRQEAEQKMFEVHGKEWAFLYSEEDFSHFIREGFYRDAKELPAIYVHVDITFGEMRSWIERFNQILGGAQTLKEKRLAALMTDIERAYDIPILNNDEYNRRNSFVVSLYRAVSEARNI